MKIITMKLADLIKPEKNVRIHTEQQLKEFRRSIKMFGQIRPIVVDENNVILAGNGLYDTLISMGAETADVYKYDNLTENQKKKLMIADNKIFSLGIENLPDAQKPKTPQNFKELLLHEIIGDNDSTMDDAAATYAMDKVLKEILSDCNDGQEIEDRLQNASEDDICEWIISFEVEYILEYSAELFQSHIFDKGSNPEDIKREIRGWLHNELDEKLSKEMGQIDFNSQDGKDYLDSLTSDILDIWKQE